MALPAAADGATGKGHWKSVPPPPRPRHPPPCTHATQGQAGPGSGQGSRGLPATAEAGSQPGLTPGALQNQSCSFCLPNPRPCSSAWLQLRPRAGSRGTRHPRAAPHCPRSALGRHREGPLRCRPGSHTARKATGPRTWAGSGWDRPRQPPPRTPDLLPSAPRARVRPNLPHPHSKHSHTPVPAHASRPTHGGTVHPCAASPDLPPVPGVGVRAAAPSPPALLPPRAGRRSR